MTRPIIAADYHRNGVGGTGFYVGLVGEADKSQKLVVFFPEGGSTDDTPKGYQTRIAVVDVDMAARGDVQFGSNSWRGADQYQDEALAIKAKADADQEAELAALYGDNKPKVDIVHLNPEEV